MVRSLSATQIKAFEQGISTGRSTAKAFDVFVMAHLSRIEGQPERVEQLKRGLLADTGNRSGESFAVIPWFLLWGDSWFSLIFNKERAIPYHLQKKLAIPDLEFNGDNNFSWPTVKISEVAINFEDLIAAPDPAGSTPQKNLLRLLAKFKEGMQNKKSPSTILLSMSGNDFVESHKNHALLFEKSAMPNGINFEGLKEFLEVIEERYIVICAAITFIWEQVYGTGNGPKKPRIVTHGYGYTIPDGVTDWSRFSLFDGLFPERLNDAWLLTTFLELGYDQTEATDFMKDYINALNERLKNLNTLSYDYIDTDGQSREISLSHLRHCDLRPVLEPKAGESYQDIWVNELHLNRTGLDRAAVEMAKVINGP